MDACESDFNHFSGDGVTCHLVQLRESGHNWPPICSHWALCSHTNAPGGHFIFMVQKNPCREGGASPGGCFFPPLATPLGGAFSGKLLSQGGAGHPAMYCRRWTRAHVPFLQQDLHTPLPGQCAPQSKAQKRKPIASSGHFWEAGTRVLTRVPKRHGFRAFSGKGWPLEMFGDTEWGRGRV